MSCQWLHAFGIRTGYAAAFGVFTGDLILIVCTILGAASLLHAFPWLFTLLKVVGALLLRLFRY